MANHYAKDADDFAARLNRLTEEEFVSLIELIRVGEEGITCLPTECAEVLIEQAMRRAGAEAANEQYALYEMGTQCQ